jgi:hypothetical protein
MVMGTALKERDIDPASESVEGCDLLKFIWLRRVGAFPFKNGHRCKRRRRPLRFCHEVSESSVGHEVSESFAGHRTAFLQLGTFKVIMGRIWNAKGTVLT